MGNRPDPVFSADDRVPSGGGGGGNNDIPAELQGKSPAEIIQFFRERETRIRAEAAPVPPARVPDNPTPPPTREAFWNDPSKAVDSRIAAVAVTKEDFDRMTAGARQSMVWAAEQMVKQKFPDFNRVEKKIREIMALMPAHQHTDPTIWETVYHQAKGLEFDRLSTEDRNRPPSSAEPVTPSGGAPPMPTDLTRIPGPPDAPHKTAAFVADHLGQPHDVYLKGKVKYEKDGLLPLTVDNRRGVNVKG